MALVPGAGVFRECIPPLQRSYGPTGLASHSVGLVVVVMQTSKPSVRVLKDRKLLKFIEEAEPSPALIRPISVED
jgi:hypothetical protein